MLTVDLTDRVAGSLSRLKLIDRSMFRLRAKKRPFGDEAADRRQSATVKQLFPDGLSDDQAG